MEFTVNASKLLDVLELLQGAVERKNTIPILSHCLVEAEAQGLRLTATDLEIGVRLFCPAQVKIEGNAAIPARRLLDIAKSLAEGDVRLRDLENNRVQVTSGRSSFKLAAMAKENFPAIPDLPPMRASLPAGTLGGLIDRTSFAISDAEGRYKLNACLLVLKPGRVEMIATDGSRLALAGREMRVEGLQNEERLLIPLRAVGQLRRLAEAFDSETAISIGNDESHLFFRAGDSILIARQMTGDFPNYQAVLPRSNGRRATVDAGSLREALDRVSLLAPERNRAVALDFASGQITLSSNGGDLGEATEPVDASFQGEPLRVGFNASFILDFLGAVKDGSVAIAMKDEQSAAEFKPAGQGDFDYTCVVMPMRF